jgi:hypothetical protein
VIIFCFTLLLRTGLRVLLSSDARFMHGHKQTPMIVLLVFYHILPAFVDTGPRPPAIISNFFFHTPRRR